MEPHLKTMWTAGVGPAPGRCGVPSRVAQGKDRRRGPVRWPWQADPEEHWAGRLFAARRSARLAA